MQRETQRQTPVLVVHPQQPQPALIDRAARTILAGGAVAFPTETVYGLGANALDAQAVRGIFVAKGRPAHDPVIVHVTGLAMMGALVQAVPETAVRLAERFWPGALTLVLPKSPRVPDVVTADGPTVAIRCPNHPIAQALIQAAGVPIAAPSANRFSHTSPTTAQHVLDDLDGKIDLILDGGSTSIGVESTVLSLVGDRPLLLRPGGVTLEALEAVLGAVAQRDPARLDPEPLPSPGLLARHYAPRATLALFTGPTMTVRAAMTARAQDALAAGQRVGLLVADEDRAALSGLNCPLVAIGPERDPAQVASRLFDAMRMLDARGVDLILARDYAPDGLGLAIRDRLRRAAQQVVDCGSLEAD